MKNKALLDISNRDNIYKLVSLFYIKVRKDPALGHIFNHIINDWPAHLDRLTDFWETNLFAVVKYRGNPIHVHQKVDLTCQGTVNEKHFTIWLQLWFETIDQLFFGEKANITKRRARKMSTHLYLKIYEFRNPQNLI